MPNDPTEKRRAARKTLPSPHSDPSKDADLCRRRTGESLHRLLRQTDDPLHRQYLILLFDGENHPRIVREAQQLSKKMQARLSRGSDEFQRQPSDLINHAMLRICRVGKTYGTKREFLEDFFRKLDNHDRANRRSQPARVLLDRSELSENEQAISYEANVLTFPRPDILAEQRSDIDTLWRAVCDTSPELAPLLQAMSRGILKSSDLADHLGIKPKDCRNLRSRLRRLATRMLGDRM